MTFRRLDKASRLHGGRLGAPFDGGYHYELIKGELRPMSPSGGPHGDATSRVSFYVNGVVYGEDLGDDIRRRNRFLVGRDPDTVMAPDFAFVAEERLPDPLPEGYVPVVPDLAVETRSPNDTERKSRTRWKNGWQRVCGWSG